MEQYTGFAGVYDELMDNVPYGAWLERVLSILRDQGIGDGLVLDLGCGTGRFTQMLSDAGYDMIGVDLSAEMLSVAMDRKEESGADILYLQQDMREFELYGTVRAIVSLCDCMNYLTEPADFLQVLRLCRNYLDPGGLFLFDLNTVYKYEHLLSDNTFAETREDCSFIWENEYDPDTRINTYVLTLFVREDGKEDRFIRHEEVHRQRAYSTPEVEDLIAKAGLTLLSMVPMPADSAGDITQSAYQTTPEIMAQSDSGECERILYIVKKEDRS